MANHLKTIDVADLMISRVQALCHRLRQEGFQCSANDLEDTFILLYDRMLPFLATNDFDNPVLLEIAEEMLVALDKVEKVTELVDFREHIMRVFHGVGSG